MKGNFREDPAGFNRGVGEDGKTFRRKGTTSDKSGVLRR